MSDDIKKQNMFTLSASYILEQLEKTDEQIIGSQFLLQHFIESGQEAHRLLIPTVVDILWLNYSIVKTITPYVEDPVTVDNPDTGEEEYMIDEPALLTLQTLMVSRFSVNKELNQLSYTIGIH
tara:strand:- start:2560 stop:2928 length:369 start_codon:yes stop_codon:yes gene_type:complete